MFNERSMRFFYCLGREVLYEGFKMFRDRNIKMFKEGSRRVSKLCRRVNPN